MEKKDIDIELRLLVAPVESDLSMAEQMRNKKENEKKIDELCVQSDELIHENKFEEALFKLIEAYKIVTEHPWSIKQSQVYDLIQNAQKKRQDFIKKEEIRILQQKEKEIEEEKQKQLLSAHQQRLEQEKKEKEKKLLELHNQKQKEEEISTKAFKLLEEGQNFLKNKEFDETITKYQAAKDLFLSIKWSGEAEKLDNSIQEFLKEKQLLIQKQERERKLREEEEKEWKEKEEKLGSKPSVDSKLEEKSGKKLRKANLRKEIENQIYSKLDEASALEKKGYYSNAIQAYDNVKNLMEQLEWRREITKIDDTIKGLEIKIQKQSELQKKEHLSQQLKEKEERELQLKIQAQEEERRKLEAEKEKEIHQVENKLELEQKTSEKAFEQIEAIEKEVKYYKEHAKIEHYKIECPYLRAKGTYENSRNLLLSIGWKVEAEKLNSSISMYESLYQQDLRERTIYLKRKEKEIQEQQKLEESIRKHKEEQESEELQKKEKLRAIGIEKDHVDEVSKLAFAQIELIEKQVKYYKDNVITENFKLESPFLKARDVYKSSQQLFLSIGWKEEAEKLNSSISLYEHLHLNDQKERATLLLRTKKNEIDQQQIEETIRLKRLEKEKQDQMRIQKLQEQGKRKLYQKEMSKRAFARIEEIEKEIKYYKDHAVEENYQMKCPYLDAVNIYKQSREDLIKIGWKKEADNLSTSISMYENLYKKDQIERQKIVLLKKKQEEDEKKLQEAIHLQQIEKEKKEREHLRKLQEEGKRKEYENEVSKQAFARIEDIEKEVKYYKEHVASEHYGLDCPYLRAKEIYEISRQDLLGIGWKEEADKLLTSISMYNSLYQKDQLEREKIKLLKQKQEQEEKELEETIRRQKERREEEERERILKLEKEGQKKEEENKISQTVFQEIEEIEKEVKYYKEHVVSEEYRLQCPYTRAKEIYEISRKKLLEIGWKEEADKLKTSIDLYEKLERNDVKDREKFQKKKLKEEEEQRKLEESIRIQKEEEEKQERERLHALREENRQKQHESEVSKQSFHMIEEIEKEVAFYKERVRVENFSLPCPYQRAKEVYQEAKNLLLSIGWKKEADKLSNSISLYTQLEKEDLEIRQRYKERVEVEKQKEMELQETIRKERERLAEEEKKRQTEQAQKDQQRQEHEKLQEQAYTKLEEGNNFIQQKSFVKATEALNTALKIFKKIKWKTGVKLTEDAIKYKDNEKQKFERLLEQESLALQEQRKKEQEFQKFIEEQRRNKEQEEQNRKLELLRMNIESKKIGAKQEEALRKLEEGNELVQIREFKKANNIYLEALNIFKEIGWIDGVERTKESISHNLIEEQRYNQQLELQKKEEEQRKREKREMEELIRQREALTKIEEEQKRLKFEQQHELAERIKQQQQEASNMLEEGNSLILQKNFDEADKIFNQALKIFKNINWEHGIKITKDVLQHSTEERKRYENLKLQKEKARREQIRQKQELEKMLIEQKLLTEQEAQLKELKQKEESEKLSKIQSMQDEAMKYLERGNHEIRNQNFDEARKLFTIAMKIFQNMGWQKGIEMVNTALDYNEKELIQFNNQKLQEEQKKNEAVQRQEEINKLIQESKEEEIKKKLEWKQKLEEKTRRIDEENQIKDQIFTLLEKGSELAANNDFLKAIEFYKKTIPLFEKISWSLKRDQVIDLIDTTQQEYESYRAHLAKEEALRQKQIQEEEELEILIKSEKEKEEERRKIIQEEQLRQQEIDKFNEELKKEATEEINKASVMLSRRKFDNALDSLNVALENFKKLGWTKEAQVTEEQIAEVQHQKREAYKPADEERSASDMKMSEKGYENIDEADKLIRRKKYKAALPYLEEAKQVFEKIQWTKAIKMVEIRIKKTERLLKEKQELIEKLKARRSRKTEKEAYRLLEKVDKFRRENHFDYALTSAKEALKIFQDLGWEREANEVLPLIETIQKQIEQQTQIREKDSYIRAEKIKIEEEEERKIQEIIEERRRRRREAREKLKQQ